MFKDSAFFLLLLLFFLCLPVSEAQNAAVGTGSFPVITRMDSRDTTFRQYISDVESNRRRLAGIQNRIIVSQVEESAAYLTIYQYIVREGEDLFSIAARCNMPYSALASINRLANVTALEAGRTILLPSYPGLFIPENYQSELEKLLAASRIDYENSVPIRVNRGAGSETFFFFPGADFTPTERTFFLNAGMRFPLRYFRITSRFGIRQNPVTGSTLMHQGMDLAAPEGTEVYAIADGTVTTIGNDPIYGIYIIVTHRDRLSSLYGHLQRVETTLNTTVRSGTLIGRVGTTGQSTGPHLHFELRQDGRPIDPARRLRN